MPDDIRIYLAVYRVETKNVDIVLSMNVPVSAQAEEEAYKAIFETAVRTLHIVDFGLFA